MTDKAPPKPVPNTLLQVVPSSYQTFSQISMLTDELNHVGRDMDKLREAGDAVELAKGYVVLHRIQSRLEDVMTNLNKVFELYKNKYLPEALDAASLSNVPLKEGFRVGVSTRTWASIPKDKRSEAYAWLRSNNLGDLIVETVNASTLSATAKSLMEENRELPEGLFKVTPTPTTSVTQTP